MKTVVLTGISCLFLAGGICFLKEKSDFSGIASIKQSLFAANPAGQFNNRNNTAATERPTSGLTSINHHNKQDSTLNDSHWLDDATFQKAVEADLMSESQEPKADVPGETTAPEAIIPASPKDRKAVPAAEAAPSIRQLILELSPPDTTTNKKVPVEVV